MFYEVNRLRQSAVAVGEVVPLRCSPSAAAMATAEFDVVLEEEPSEFDEEEFEGGASPPVFEEIVDTPNSKLLRTSRRSI